MKFNTTTGGHKMANLTKKEKKVIRTAYKKHGARLQALKIKKVRTMQGQYLSQDNGLIVRLNGVKFPMTKGDRYLTRDRQRAITMAMDEYKREVNINHSQKFIGTYI
tara:strand:- start:111 stop:431 length:321 start_codon:yes stop_codon:yes gene_type:complete